MIIEDKYLRNHYSVFKSRRHAGFLLGPFISLEDFDVLFMVPAGGVPVGLGLLEFPLIPRNAQYDLLIVRKIQIPNNPEAGMGAVTPDGQIFLNERIVDILALHSLQLDQQIERAKQQIEKRRREFQVGALPQPQVYGRNILIVDDGIASGYSIMAGAKWLRRLGAEKIIVAVPTAPESSLARLENSVDKIICLNIRTRYPFAVADAYKDWYDLNFRETRQYLKEIELLKEIT
ncbi:MAG: phosphoribosyltransferase [Candidatus Thorarchaeota archaeon]